MTNVRYAALARLRDGVPLFSYKQNADAECESTVGRVLCSGNIKPSSHLTVVINETIGTLHLAAGEGDVLAVVTDAAYPRRTAFQLLGDLRQRCHAHGLDAATVSACSTAGQHSRACAGWLKETFRKYNDLAGVDRMTEVSTKVDEVRVMMEGNINRLIDNAEALNQVEDKAENLRQGASHFQRQSDDMRRLMWWRNFKMKCIVFLLVFSIVGYIVVPIIVNVYKTTHSDDDKD